LRPPVYPSDRNVRDSINNNKQSSARKGPACFLNYYLDALGAFEGDDIVSANKRLAEYLIPLLEMFKAYMSGLTAARREIHRLNISNSFYAWNKMELPLNPSEWRLLRLRIHSFYALIRNWSDFTLTSCSTKREVQDEIPEDFSVEKLKVFAEELEKVLNDAIRLE